jgi:hypothetical protein
MLLKKMNKRSVLQLAVLLSIAAFAIVLGACPEDEIFVRGGTQVTGGTTELNTDALEEKIAEAESAKVGVVTASAATDVAQGAPWVTEAELTAFNNAIANAKLALTNAKTQAEVDAAVTILDAALTVFNGAKTKTGNRATLILTELNNKIAEAHAAKAGIEVNTASGNVAMGSWWVLQEDMTTFDTAITTAENARNAATQGEVNTAVITLNTAITTFNEAKKQGSKISDFTLAELIAKIAEAKAAKLGVVVNTASANVAQGTYWVTQEIMTAFDNTITEAENALTASQAEIDTAVITLSAAITTFVDAKQQGTKINTDQLAALIASAKAAKIGVVVDTASANVAEGVSWVIQVVMTDFDTAITVAEAALTATTQSAVDAAVSTLGTAITVFTNAQQTGSKPAVTSVDYGTTLSWGSTYSPAALGLTPGNTTTELNLNWLTGGGTSVTGKGAYVRFIEGTKNAGYALIEKTGTVATATSSSSIYHAVTVTGLVPGKSYQYSVSDNGTNWSPMYDYKVPVATGAWKFAVLSDAQINTSGNSNATVDKDSRYPATTVTTTAGWLETMVKVAAADVSFIVSCGDQVDSTSTSTVPNEYTWFFSAPQLRNLPLAPSVGNHDTATQVRYHYNLPNDPNARSQTIADLGNYYYLYNNILFVGLNTGAASPSSRTAAVTYINRFETTIKNAKIAYPNYDWLIVQHHKSTASVGDHLADRDIQYYVEAGFERIMSEQHVDFVLAGHDHVYARSWPLAGKDGGKVSVPDKTAPGPNNTFTNPGNPIYLTFTTASGIKYYAVSSDPYFKYDNTLYVQNNTEYPYLGNSTTGDGAQYYGSVEYMTNKRLPVSNAAFVQPYIPSYTVVEVNNNPAVGSRSITFKTYPIATKSGTDSGATLSYSFDENTPYDTVTVIK